MERTEIILGQKFGDWTALCEEDVMMEKINCQIFTTFYDDGAMLVRIKVEYGKLQKNFERNFKETNILSSIPPYS